MVRIAYYVSDHGYGHATRSIALVRALIAEGRGAVVVEVMNHHAHGLLTRALGSERGVKVIDRTTDVGFVCQESRLAFDPGATAIAVNGWISGWKRFVAEEVARLRARPPDLVLSDVAPEPLLVAERLGVPSRVASNFTWVDQYEPHLRADLIAPLRGSYALAERGYAYPMRTAMSGLRGTTAAGLVTREPSRSRSEVRRQLGVDESAPLVHLGLGWSANAGALASELDLAGLPADVRLLVSRNLEGTPWAAGRDGRIVAIPSHDTDAHDYIAACDLVVAKAGYGTISEAIAGRVPILAAPVEGSPESEMIARTVAQLGIGLAHPRDPVVRAPILDEAAEMLADIGRYRQAYARLPAEYASGAAAHLARRILEDA